MQVLTEKIPHVRSVTIGFWVNVGSRDEFQEAAGISHFIEHLMFKGTNNRKARDIAEALDAVGGHLNAFTTKEYTCYYVRVLDEFFEYAFDIISDMLLNSCFSAEDLECERNVILEEIKMNEDTPDEQVYDIFAHTLWGEHPLGRPVIGFEEIINNLTRQEIIDFFNKYYISSNLIIAAAGNIEHERVVDKVNNIFGHVRSKENNRLFQKAQPHNDIKFLKKETEQVHICTGGPGLPLAHENLYVFQLINTVLGGGISSRLFQQVREEKGLVYTIFSHHSSYHDGGVFCIYLGLSRKNIEKALELVYGQVRDIQENGVTQVELQRAKDQMRGNLLLSLEHVNSRMSRLGKSQMYLGKIIQPEEIVKQINNIDNEQIKQVAREYLKPQDFCLASVGSLDDMELVKKLKD
ncbi:MAG: insulinase family protein [Clostridiales bacterium]|nr:insulinase family protein [Clostridiales bacterium]MCF8022191.1 insulinase family protein [Clostridiales bacterium]